MWTVAEINIKGDKAIDYMVIDTTIRKLINKLGKNTNWTFYRFSENKIEDKISSHGIQFKIENITISRVKKIIEKDSIIIKLMENAYIQEINYYEKVSISDPIWPLTMRKNWPFFANGFCKMLLGLIGYYVQEYEINLYENIGTIIDKYKMVDKSISILYNNWSSHAFFHHISAVFGYEKSHIIF